MRYNTSARMISLKDRRDNIIQITPARRKNQQDYLRKIPLKDPYC